MAWTEYVNAHTKEAEALFNRISYGHDNAVSRPINEYEDRCFRKMIEEANNTDDCIINVGDGYFRPDLRNEADRHHLKHYYLSEIQRGMKIMGKTNKMLENAKARDPEGYKLWEREKMA